jgi:hypothetical protein
MAVLKLYHTGYDVIRKPDLTAGRKNADFGQGFYLSAEPEFSMRWARQRRGVTTWLNTYELDPEGLLVKRLDRDGDWFSCIFANRSGAPDPLAGFDLILGPIAADTLYDTWGVITSGILQADQALKLLQIGPVYTQAAIKTEKAAAALRFRGAREISPEEIAGYRETVRFEEARFQEEFAKLFLEMTAGEGQ